MGDEDKNTSNQKNEQDPEEPQETYKPASKKKRIAAWIGIILMVLLVLMYCYSMATGSILEW
ncbi:MAG: hypothetical protein LUC17_04555 [Oscillospiraceae bacterium]|nr:hypothetical protein [Oscillospiraceae bacterium]